MAFPPSCGQIVRRVRARATQLSAGPRLSRVQRVFAKAARDVHGDHAMAEAFRFAHDERPRTSSVRLSGMRSRRSSSAVMMSGAVICSRNRGFSPRRARCRAGSARRHQLFKRMLLLLVHLGDD
jgi:hypothetical protein